MGPDWLIVEPMVVDSSIFSLSLSLSLSLSSLFSLPMPPPSKKEERKRTDERGFIGHFFFLIPSIDCNSRLPLLRIFVSLDSDDHSGVFTSVVLYIN